MIYRLRGFTLIELIVVIGIIAVVAAIVILAINPARQFAQARNARRSNDVKAVLEAANQYAASNSGLYPPTLTADCAAATQNPTVITELAPTYISSIPTEPRAGNAAYTICFDRTGGEERVRVAAPGAELGATISVTR